MLSASPIYELGQNLMIVVHNGAIYHTENASRPAGDCLFLSDLAFPLVKTETLSSLEKRYIKKQQTEINKLEEQFLNEVAGKSAQIKALEDEIAKNTGLQFFVREVIPHYIRDSGETSPKIPHPKNISNESILEKLVGGNVAIINKRVFPLQDSKVPSFVRLSGKNYSFSASDKRLDTLENQFQLAILNEVKKKVLAKFDDFKSLNEEKISSTLKGISAKAAMRKVGNCFEYGEIGYDPTNKRIYCRMAAHNDSYTGRYYNEGQSAFSLALSPQGIVDGRALLFREDETKNFRVESSTICIGVKQVGQGTHALVSYMVRAAKNIVRNGASHE